MLKCNINSRFNNFSNMQFNFRIVLLTRLEIFTFAVVPPFRIHVNP